MLDTKGTANYWQSKFGEQENPCHYANTWQNKYAYIMRLAAFKSHDFEGKDMVVDVGCGIGEYTAVFARRHPKTKFLAFDFPFNVEVAKQQHGDIENIIFVPGGVPDEKIREAIQAADVVFTTTVYVHLSDEARKAFIDYMRGMKPDARLMLLEYIPDKVPGFQKDLDYKNVETPKEIEQKMKEAGLTLEELRHVNFVDSYFFFRFGPSRWTYWLTLLAERLLHLIGYTKSKYKLMIFKK